MGIFTDHRYASTLAEAAAYAVAGGLDLEDANDAKSTVFSGLPDALKQGLIPQEYIDRSVSRLMYVRMRTGEFDPVSEQPYRRIGLEQIRSKAHLALSLRTAEESFVLLKNEAKTLPLSSKPRTVAVVGPFSDCQVRLSLLASLLASLLTSLLASLLRAATSESTRLTWTLPRPSPPRRVCRMSADRPSSRRPAAPTRSSPASTALTTSTAARSTTSSCARRAAPARPAAAFRAPARPTAAESPTCAPATTRAPWWTRSEARTWSCSRSAWDRMSSPRGAIAKRTAYVLCLCCLCAGVLLLLLC